MYTYTAGATGLDAAMPTWVQSGGLEAWIKRMQDPKVRAQVIEEMKNPERQMGESAAALWRSAERAPGLVQESQA
jgi:hypothetical protein